MTGLISKQKGRSNGDRQMFFLNKRPVDLPKVVKAINEVFHSFTNKKEFPVAFLSITLDTSNDINQILVYLNDILLFSYI